MWASRVGTTTYYINNLAVARKRSFGLDYDQINYPNLFLLFGWIFPIASYKSRSILCPELDFIFD